MRKYFITIVSLSVVTLTGCSVVNSLGGQLTPSPVETTTTQAAVSTAARTYVPQEKGGSENDVLTPKQQSGGMTDAWFKQNFVGYTEFDLAPNNPNMYLSPTLEGVPLPDGAPAESVVWQRPMCIPVPFTVEGPSYAIDQNGTLLLGGWTQTKIGAVAAGAGMLYSNMYSEDRLLAALVNSWVSEDHYDQAVSLIESSPELLENSNMYQTSNPDSCDPNIGRIGAFYLDEYTSDTAVVSYYTPVDDSNGWVVQVHLTWLPDKQEWSYDFDSYLKHGEKARLVGIAEAANFRTW